MVNESISLFNFLHSNKLFPALKVFLNFVFIISISSFLFESVYFQYELIDLTDYKKIYTFLFKGDFLIPITLFLLVWLFTYITAVFIFSSINRPIHKRIVKSIRKQRFITKEMVKLADKGSEMTKGYKISKEYGNKWFVKLYKNIKQNEVARAKALKGMKKAQEQCQQDTLLIIRGFICILIAFCTLPYFGWKLLFLIILIVLAYLSIMIIVYQIIEITPELARKIDKEIAQLENEYKK